LQAIHAKNAHERMMKFCRKFLQFDGGDGVGVNAIQEFTAQWDLPKIKLRGESDITGTLHANERCIKGADAVSEFRFERLVEDGDRATGVYFELKCFSGGQTNRHENGRPAAGVFVDRYFAREFVFPGICDRRGRQTT